MSFFTKIVNFLRGETPQKVSDKEHIQQRIESLPEQAAPEVKTPEVVVEPPQPVGQPAVSIEPVIPTLTEVVVEPEKKKRKSSGRMKSSTKKGTTSAKKRQPK